VVAATCYPCAWAFVIRNHVFWMRMKLRCCVNTPSPFTLLLHHTLGSLIIHPHEPYSTTAVQLISSDGQTHLFCDGVVRTYCCTYHTVPGTGGEVEEKKKKKKKKKLECT
jgi:hypothetical protein